MDANIYAKAALQYLWIMLEAPAILPVHVVGKTENPCSLSDAGCKK
jgi:hypothetical protein